MLAGSPLSYWAGVHGKNPMRYLGGLLGGTWLTSLAGDLGNGIFDGANLVANFEALHPDNTYWKKIYNVYSKIDTEPPRFLEFEKWWGSPGAAQCRGDAVDRRPAVCRQQARLGRAAQLRRLRIDLRNIKSPIIVFCSWGDDITPPQQALGLDPRPLRPRRRDRRRRPDDRLLPAPEHWPSRHLRLGQSGDQGARGICPIDGHDRFDAARSLRGGHHRSSTRTVENPELVQGNYLFSLETRKLDDIRALGGNSPEDDLAFATAARVSEVTPGALPHADAARRCARWRPKRMPS